MAQFSQASSEEVGDLRMKRIEAIVLLVMFVLGFCIFSEAQSNFIAVKIIPPEPTSADEVSVEVKVAHSDFFRVSFSRLHRLPQQVFLALVSAEPVACLSQSSFETLALSESTHTYQVGRLNPGRYEFQIQYCFHDCPSPPFGLTDGTEQCQLVESQGFQVTEAPLEKIIDRNGDGYINDDEILWAISLWITGAVVPGTAQAIDDATMLRLIDLWIKQAKV